jgi:hypothetical protein
MTLSGDFSKFPGLGIQVNNWYWTVVSLPVQKGDPQNPDNSGAQFAISDQCVLSRQPAWYRKGIPTYLIAQRWMDENNYPQQLYGCGDAELLRSSGDRGQHLCRPVGNHQQPRGRAVAATMIRVLRPQPRKRGAE